jgi:CheY-like chemotaxis protein
LIRVRLGITSALLSHNGPNRFNITRVDRFDEGIYSIGAVVKMLDVPAQTLRSWEMRYQRIVPERSIGGQRLYSRNQVAELQFVLAEIGRGCQPAEAHRLLDQRSRYPVEPSPRVQTARGVLLAERDPYAAELSEYFLRTEGYTTCIAMTAGAARDLLNEEPLSLAVIDLLISGGAGLDLCRQAREQRRIPVVAVSVLESRDHAIDAGADAFLRKPLHSLQLVSTVRDLLGTSASLRDRDRVDAP